MNELLLSTPKFQNCYGHTGLTVTLCGFHVSKSHPFLGASSDGAVYDPSNTVQPFGFWKLSDHLPFVMSSPWKLARNITFLHTSEQ